MFEITESAAAKAKEVLETEGKAAWGLRIYTSGGGCCGPSYGIDLEETPGDDDKVTEKHGLKVFTDADTFAKLEGMSIDFIDDGQNQGFVIKGDESAAPSCSSGCSSC